MNLLFVICVCGIVGISLAIRIKIPTKSRNDDLFSEDEFTFPVEDTKDPSNFTGNVMKASILMSQVKNKGKGEFKYAVETENGIEVEQIGKLRNDNKTFVVMGSYTYTGANGKRYRVRYTADEFGYHPITELDLDIPDPVAAQPAPRPKPFAFAPRVTTTRPTTTTTAAPTVGPSNAYLPPSNDYLPPSNTYLPASNEYPLPKTANEPPPPEQLPPFYSAPFHGQNVL
ncbi:pupal cuticle protein [Malaya genurostris]|uniref:pupal cuticle protein n=1 Tax=Malaya genurostris TaxID=325434 RepID=UPI0026F382C5|nr:pupal cuticle protein [Malaya genurostris]